MYLFYPLFIAFLLVFISELGDKTQLLVLSFSSKIRASTILIGVALGSFFSHGIAILFGSSVALLDNNFIHSLLEIITFISFIIFGFLSFLPKREKKESTKKDNFIMKLSKLGLSYILVIAFSIAIGEIGDKTFLASVGLGISYPNYKLFLIIGAILGMVISDLLAILFGRFLSEKIPEALMQKLSGLLFIIFGIVGFINFII